MSLRSDKSSKKSLRRRLSSLADCDIVKKGTLHIKRPPKHMKIRLKTWQTRYLVLRDDSYDRGCRLEIYPNENNWNESRYRERIIIDLRQVSHIEEYRQSRSFPFSMVITRRGETPLILGTSGEAELREWIVAVQLLACKTLSGNGTDYYLDNYLPNGLPMSLSVNDPLTLMAMRNNSLNASIENSIYRSPHNTIRRPNSIDAMSPFSTAPTKGVDLKGGYLVEIQPTAAANRNRLNGEYRLQVTGNCIVLRRVDHNLEVVRWGLVHIRKLRSEDMQGDSNEQILILEANIHCGQQEGTYQFKTSYSKNIIAKVREALRHMSIRSPQAAINTPGLCHKSESDPCLERRRFQSSSSSTSSMRQISRDWLNADCPPRQMAPLPGVRNSPTGWSQCSHCSSNSGSQASSDREQDDELPPPYLEVLAADDGETEEARSSSGSSIYAEEPDSQGSVFESAPPRHVTRGDSGFCEMSDDVRSGRKALFRAAIDSCPDEPPPPPPRPRQAVSSHLNYMSTGNFTPPNGEQKEIEDISCAPPLPPRDF